MILSSKIYIFAYLTDCMVFKQRGFALNLTQPMFCIIFSLLSEISFIRYVPVSVSLCFEPEN